MECTFKKSGINNLTVSFLFNRFIYNLLEKKNKKRDHLTNFLSGEQNLPLPPQRGACIKGVFWPPLEPKPESCFSPISSYWFVRRKAQVKKSSIYFTFIGCYGNQNGQQNRLKIEKLSF